MENLGKGWQKVGRIGLKVGKARVNFSRHSLSTLKEENYSTLREIGQPLMTKSI
jgi:hypothetical protein